MAEEKQND